MAQKDITAKTLESYNDVFADIVNGFLFDGEKVISPDELTPADTFSQYKAEGKIREQERDVSKFWRKMDIQLAFIGIENQSVPDKYMPLRVFSYDGAAYRSQLNPNADQTTVNHYPVITLVLYFGTKDWTYGKSLYDCFDIPDKLKPFVNNYTMNFYSMKDIAPESIQNFTSDFKTIAEFFFKMNHRDSNTRFSDRKLDHPEETLDLISVFSGDERFRQKYNESIHQEIKGGVAMGEFYDRILAEGEAKGRIEGVAEGRIEGRIEGRAEIVKNLLDIGRSIKEIAEFFKTDEAEIEGLLAKG